MPLDSVSDRRKITTRAPFPPFLPLTSRYRIMSCGQSTVSSRQNWYWVEETFPLAVSLLQIEMLITKFEYTAVEEVDPVDIWAIAGAIGGVWRKCTYLVHFVRLLT